MVVRKYFVYSNIEKNKILLLFIFLNLALILVIAILLLNNHFFEADLIVPILVLSNISLAIFFIYQLKQIDHQIKKSESLLNSIKIEDKKVVLPYPMRVVKGRLIISHTVRSATMVRDRSRERFSLYFKPEGEPLEMGIIDFLKLDNFIFRYTKEFIELDIPAWKIDDPEYSWGKNFVVLSPIEPTIFEETEGSIRIAYKNDHATLNYRVYDTRLEYDVLYMHDELDKSTTKAEVSIEIWDPIFAIITKNEISETHQPKKFSLQLLPNLSDARVLLISPTALRFGAAIGGLAKFVRRLREALNLPETLNIVTSKRILIKLILARKLARDVKKEVEIGLKVK